MFFFFFLKPHQTPMVYDSMLTNCLLRNYCEFFFSNLLSYILSYFHATCKSSQSPSDFITGGKASPLASLLWANNSVNLTGLL